MTVYHSYNKLFYLKSYAPPEKVQTRRSQNPERADPEERAGTLSKPPSYSNPGYQLKKKKKVNEPLNCFIYLINVIHGKKLTTVQKGL